MAVNNKCSRNKQVTNPNPVSINAVYWDGEDLPDCFQICNGDSIQPLVYDIASYVCDILSNIDVSEVTVCGDYVQLLGAQDKNIANLIQILLTKGCSLAQLVEELQEQINQGIPLDIDFKCLDVTLDPCATPGNMNISQVIQVIVDNFCELKNEFEEFKNEVRDSIEDEIGDFIDNLLVSPQANRIIKNNSGSNPKYTLRGFVPPHTPLPYFGPLTYFDASGKGSGIMDGFYICNGQNGTIDMRGFHPIGATQGLGTNPLDPIVDPTLNVVTPTASYSQGDKGGKIANYLNINQIPDHSHSSTVNETGHFHYMFGPNVGGTSSLGTDVTVSSFFSNSTNLGYSLQAINPPTNPATMGKTSTSTTGVTVTVGNIQGYTALTYVDNRTPYKACVWIQMIN